MPIADTSFEQVVVALATKWTGEESVLLLPGDETDTPANEHPHSTSTQNEIFILSPAKRPDHTFTKAMQRRRTVGSAVRSEIAKHFRTEGTYLQQDGRNN